MGKYDNYLLVSDMDGTLLNSKHFVAKENIEAVRRFTAEGGNFCVATGRPPIDADEFLTDLGINTACIYFNGSMLYDGMRGQMVKELFLEGQVWRDFAGMLAEKYNRWCVVVFTADGDYAISKPDFDDETLWDPAWKGITHHYIFCELADVADKDWLKLVVIGPSDQIEVIRAEGEKWQLGQLSNSFRAGADCYEFIHLEASKGHMLELLRELPENKGRKVVAMGDYGNDVYMLQQADVGVAAGNASEEAKAAADIIGVTNDEHLTAYVIGLIDEGKI